MKNKINPLQWSILGISIILLLLRYSNIIEDSHATCPYSFICFGNIIVKSKFTFWIYPISVITGITISIISIVYGRFFCNYVCPIGSIQDLLKSNKKNYLLKHKILKYLNSLKYIVLITTIILSYLSISYEKICPIHTIGHPNYLNFFSIIFLIFIFIFPIFISRFWCRFLCPYGALLNIFSYIGSFFSKNKKHITCNTSKCVSCNRCLKVCPMGIELNKSEINKNINCLKCLKCLKVCPINDCLDYKNLKK